jgi:5-hydroxyisourate hydrolase-like protein (transthyretin family)
MCPQSSLGLSQQNNSLLEPFTSKPAAVNITLTVIDGVSGRAADGVAVTVVGRLAGEQTFRLDGHTDEEGNFSYSPGAGRRTNGEDYTVRLDVDAYFASRGIVAGYKQVTIMVRVVHTQTDYRIGALITPFAHTTWGTW